MKKNIRNFDFEELKALVVSSGEPEFRATQIFKWLYEKGIEDFSRMSDIPEELRNLLVSDYSAGLPEAVEILKSKDGTRKFLFKLNDENFIESVLIPEKERNTVCISTQVGCKFRCAFCASGRIGFIRNLDVSEILGQILYIRFRENVKVSNIVFMGMGEPFDNYDNVIKSIMIINNKYGLNIGARKITVSTAGVVPGIEKFSKIGLQVRLSISLHACDDNTRNRLMPINRKYPLVELLGACKSYIQTTGRRITLEYILIEGINCGERHLVNLANIAKELNADVNLIPISKNKNTGFLPPSPEAVRHFADLLRDKKIRVSIRDSRGKDIDAACGQLAGKRR
ncbi:MAG TPA: 23S rRNA (adenine(2503)-C(2))-methyltransferase RlmN [bacterium]|nr:23S rRNA (adenine(2503)-C(2))-methyltransferase RlmN [bacterium]HOQ82502.1 23S rRNA (adenine(2503)-C(2))-methyltransferase RlmN [bacterium]